MLDCFICASVIVLDIETTGLSLEMDEIVEISAAVLHKRHPFDGGDDGPHEFSCIIKLPDEKRLYKETSKYTDIPELTFEWEGITQKEAADWFARIVKSCTESETGSTNLVTYNVHFSLQFLSRLLNKHGYDNLLGDLLDSGDMDVFDMRTILKDRNICAHEIQDTIMHFGLDEVAGSKYKSLDRVRAMFAILREIDKEDEGSGSIYRYSNLIGYNPKHDPEGESISTKIQYVPQHSCTHMKLHDGFEYNGYSFKLISALMDERIFIIKKDSLYGIGRFNAIAEPKTAFLIECEYDYIEPLNSHYQLVHNDEARFELLVRKQWKSGIYSLVKNILSQSDYYIRKVADCEYDTIKPLGYELSNEKGTHYYNIQTGHLEVFNDVCNPW